MNIRNFNNLIDLFYHQYKAKDLKEIFLKSLKDKNNFFTWHETYECVQKVSEELDKIIKKHDRCLLISENRPEWLITDLAIMLSKGVTVPAYTTYTERDYEYLINDCKPSVIIISDQFQYKKIKEIIKKNKFVTFCK